MAVKKKRKSATVLLREESDVFQAASAAFGMAEQMGFGRLESKLIASAVSEIATNAVRYAGKGKVTVAQTANRRGLSVVVEDKGPGIPDLDAAMKDGYSSLKTSLGVGLGAAKRAMDEFRVETRRGEGTRVRMSKFLPLPAEELTYGIVSLADEHYAFNGDELLIKEFDGDKILLAVIDGLGQGEEAQASAQLAKEIAANNYTEELETIIRKCDDALRTQGPRAGVVIGLLLVKPGSLQYAGVGDTFIHVYGRSEIPFTSRSGIVGAFKLPALQTEKRRFHRKGAVIIMCSDGIRDRFSRNDLPLDESAQRIADFIMQHYRREFGDATVLVLKFSET